MKLSIKRAYDPYAKTDGFRVLVDGLWPRGVTKAAAKIDLWSKSVAPSPQLRSWFHEDKEERLKIFLKKYDQELRKGKALAELKNIIKTQKAVTLVTGVKDLDHSHMPVLLKYLRAR